MTIRTPVEKKKLWVKNLHPVIASAFFLFISSQNSPVFAQDQPGFRPGHEEELFQEPASLPKSDLILDIPEGEKAIGEQANAIKLTLSQVDLVGATVFSKAELSQYYQDKIGQEISLADVYRFAEKISLHYKNAGYMLSRALIPAQTIEQGKITLRVVEGFIDKISIEGLEGESNADQQSELIHRYLDPLLKANPLKVEELERALLLLNDLAGLQAKSIIRPSKTTPEASELVINASFDYLDGKVKLNNFSSKFQGPYQGIAIVNANSIFGLGEQYQFLYTKGEQSEMHFRQLSAKFPIGTDGLMLELKGNSTNSTAGDFLQPTDITTDSKSLKLNASYSIIRSRKHNLLVEAGLEMQKSTTRVLGIQVINDKTRQAYFGLNYDFSDQWAGINLISAKIHQGLNWGGVTEKADLYTSRAEAEPGFTKFTGNFSRYQGLPWGFSLLLKSKWQYTDEALYSGEEIIVGGRQFGRGYDQGSISGDRGVAGSFELQYNDRWLDDNRYQLYSFYESGHVWNLDLIDDGTVRESQGLDSTGLGVRVNYQDWSAQLEFAKPLWGLPAESGAPRSRLYFEMEYRF
ncbi:MAG: ShlB/FhaC/HecB family hemolysin secretion/activation protein [Magnetococcales bacterium]|nr:ShlB/FhaC/HecB family hemolysin secretion/activation protein [Magnetococcales bacterium]